MHNAIVENYLVLNAAMIRYCNVTVLTTPSSLYGISTTTTRYGHNKKHNVFNVTVTPLAGKGSSSIRCIAKPLTYGPNSIRTRQML